MRQYIKIDVVDPEGECGGLSICVSREVDNISPLTESEEDEILRECVKNDYIDRSDVEDFEIQMEDITGDEYEMKYWAADAYEL